MGSPDHHMVKVAMETLCTYFILRVTKIVFEYSERPCIWNAKELEVWYMLVEG